MKVNFSKYEGTGNDFIIADNRTKIFDQNNYLLIKKLCHRRFGIGADGMMLLNISADADFEMLYYNSDGNPGSMCGNGGRCMAAFARRLGIFKTETAFKATDGIHHARIEKYDAQTMCADVFLKMNDVRTIESGNGYSILDTGSPHYVKFVDDPEKTDIVVEGRKIRNSDRFRKFGVNVNFITVRDDIIHIRSYERGVEDETLSCGTGAVAAVLAAAEKGMLENKMHCRLLTCGGELTVHFEKSDSAYENIFLEGTAAFVFDGVIEI